MLPNGYTGLSRLTGQTGSYIPAKSNFFDPLTPKYTVKMTCKKKKNLNFVVGKVALNANNALKFMVYSAIC